MTLRKLVTRIIDLFLIDKNEIYSDMGSQIYITISKHELLSIEQLQYVHKITYNPLKDAIIKYNYQSKMA